MKPPLLFLDVDGVLNTRPGSLDGDKLDLVRQIIAETGCLIVLSSSWRLNERQMARIYAEMPVWAVTPEIGTWERGNEVRAFLEATPGHQYFAILDDQLSGWDRTTWGHLVLCDASEGVTPALASQAIKMLKGERP